MAVCGICNAESSKYKCPACEIPYCSLACYRPHKAEHEKSKQETATGPALAKTEVAEETFDEEREEEKDSEAFAPLLESPEIQQMLASSSLRRHLLNIHKATLEPPPVFAYRGRGGRGRGRGRGGRGEWEHTPRPWNAEKGARAGIGKIRRLREENTEVEEFVSRVIDLVQGDMVLEEE